MFLLKWNKKVEVYECILIYFKSKECVKLCLHKLVNANVNLIYMNPMNFDCIWPSVDDAMISSAQDV